MTPTVNTSPLAGLLSENATTQPAAKVSAGKAEASQGSGQASSVGKFSNILQIVKVQTSSENALNSATGQTSPWITQAPLSGSMAGSLHANGQNIGPSSLTLANSESAFDAAHHLSSADVRKKQLLANSALLSKKEVSTEQGLVAGPLPVLSLHEVPLSIKGPGGDPLPAGGNGLPDSAALANLTHRNMTAHARDASLSAGVSADDGVPVLSVQKELPASVMTPAQFDRMPVPDFAAPLAKMLHSQAGGANALTHSPANVDVSTDLIDGDDSYLEVTRSTAATSLLDRSSAVQPATTTLTLPRPAGAPGWDQGLGQRILWMVDNGLNQAELRLDPPNLGSVNIRISMHDDQAQLQFHAANSAAREALESALPKLREMFNQQGLELGDADVSDQQSQSDAREDSESVGSDGQLDADARAQVDTSKVESSSVDGEVRSSTNLSGGRVLIDEFV